MAEYGPARPNNNGPSRPRVAGYDEDLFTHSTPSAQPSGRRTRAELAGMSSGRSGQLDRGDNAFLVSLALDRWRSGVVAQRVCALASS